MTNLYNKFYWTKLFAQISSNYGNFAVWYLSDLYILGDPLDSISGLCHLGCKGLNLSSVINWSEVDGENIPLCPVCIKLSKFFYLIYKHTHSKFYFFNPSGMGIFPPIVTFNHICLFTVFTFNAIHVLYVLFKNSCYKNIICMINTTFSSLIGVDCMTMETLFLKGLTEHNKLFIEFIYLYRYYYSWYSLI